MDMGESNLEVTLESNQFDFKRLNQFKSILDEDSLFLPGSLKSVSEELISITYKLEENAVSLSTKLQDMELVERLRLAQKVQVLMDFDDSLLVPYIHPDNLFIVGDGLKIAHRGLSGVVFPYNEQHIVYFESYKALILYIINPKLSFSDLINGSAALKNPFSEEVQKAETVDEVNSAVNQQVDAQMKKQADENTMIPIKRLFIYKWGTLVFSVLTAILLVFSSFTFFKTIPYKDRIITAEIHFSNSNYAKTIDTLKKDDPKSLPAGTQYALAVSAIKQDNLSNDQKNNILKTISIKSNENVLLYWIYLGIGKYEKTLDIGQNIGDPQLILYAYQKLYNKVSADSNMRGSEKQEKLKQYKEQIQTYEETLNGKDNDDSNE